ncbi:MAG: S8 family serine peptidase, partial [Chitinophagaceae bacterium]|nr:S8 family serine peptidase [Chitinophagaceae bacterium]
FPGDGNNDPSLENAIRFGDNYFFAAYFIQKPDAFKLKEFNRAGIRILERLSSGTYILSSTTYPNRSFCERFGISGINAIPAGLKTDPRLKSNDVPAYALQSADVFKVMAGVLKQDNARAILQALDNAGLTITDERWLQQGVVKGHIHKKDLGSLASLPIVTSIQLQPPPDATLNDIARGSSGTAILQMPSIQGGRNLKGQGITIGVGDDADPTLHPDLTDRVINHTPGFTFNHGTHVTGTAAGGGILNPRMKGFAPAASVVSQYFGGIWENASVYTQQYNMVVTNNSYGSLVGDCVYAGVYDLNSRLLDEQAFLFPQLLHSFAAGNDGDITCAPFPRAYQTILGGYQSAKNILTVGRTDYTQVSSSSSSSGPVKDGRLKPEITGLGIITSLNGAGTGYFTEFGTSQSAPTITGGLALLYQRYRQLHGNANPNGALMKSILLNGARDVGTSGPDYRHGYGTLMLERSLRILENRTYTERSLTQGQIQDTVINVPSGLKQLKVFLYWHDPAASVLATNTLVHDLDLEVIAPGGQTIKPKILNPLPGGVTDMATEGEDHTNNHEQVVIELPVAGNYTLRVKGTEVLTLPQQPYAISFDYMPQELRFTAPVAAQTVQAGNITFPVAWEDETGESGTYTLSYSTDNGSSWTDIVSGLKDSTRLFFWQPGNIRSTSARLRIVKGSNTILSESFAIIPNLEILNMS